MKINENLQNRIHRNILFTQLCAYVYYSCFHHNAFGLLFTRIHTLGTSACRFLVVLFSHSLREKKLTLWTQKCFLWIKSMKKKQSRKKQRVVWIRNRGLVLPLQTLSLSAGSKLFSITNNPFALSSTANRFFLIIALQGEYIIYTYVLFYFTPPPPLLQLSFHVRHRTIREMTARQ
jgi:hypothetical protein